MNDHPHRAAIPAAQGLYDPQNEHDACGVGFVAHIKGKKSHEIIQHGLKILENLDHRGAVGADPLMGDGAGILIQIPDEYLRAEMAAQGVNLPAPGEYGVGMVFMPRNPATRKIAPKVRKLKIKPYEPDEIRKPIDSTGAVRRSPLDHRPLSRPPPRRTPRRPLERGRP